MTVREISPWAPVMWTASMSAVAEGPVKIEGSLRAPSRISALKSVRLDSVDALTAVTKDNESFPVADGVAVYELENGDYRLSSLERVRSGYTLMGYYDKAVSDGGRIRVIVARPQ